MLLDLISPFMPAVNKLLDLIPNKNERERAEAEFRTAFLSVYSEQMKAQAAINQQEAASSSLFVSGWRPFIGWVCGLGFAYTYLLSPIVTGFCSLFAINIVMPGIPSDTLMELTMGMLGLAGLRSFEKMQGVAR